MKFLRSLISIAYTSNKLLLQSFRIKTCRQKLFNNLESQYRYFGNMPETDKNWSQNSSHPDLDPIQASYLNEMCIVIDENDQPLKAASKESCHLMSNIKKGLLHRAFSVFMFNSRGEMLLQQRSDTKITFPGYFTNTCCSHPLYNEQELDETNALGVKRAAQRRLYQELGIEASEIPLNAFNFLTRVHYQAPYNETWGEHEIDYILFIQRDVTIKPNPNEVKQYCYVSKHDLKEFLESTKAPITPWFQLIMNKFLSSWWQNLENIETLQDQKIHCEI